MKIVFDILFRNFPLSLNLESPKCANFFCMEKTINETLSKSSGKNLF